MPTRKPSTPKPAPKPKPAPATKPVSASRPGPATKQSAPTGQIVVYQVTDTTTTMRSARGSWFIGTLSKGDHFYHYFSDPTREGQWIWGYTPHRYGCLDGFGWVSLDDLAPLKQNPPQLDESVRRHLQTRQRLMGTDFTDQHAHASHRPTVGSDGAEWKVTIKSGATVPFYINQRDGRPAANQLHRAKPQLTSADDGSVRVRYLVRENPNLMVADLAGTGYWGFILKQGDNFTVHFK
jgi:hypothetical protein